ncbi:MAG: hypothetical protein RR475_00750 [Clostridia bacterium]
MISGKKLKAYLREHPSILDAAFTMPLSEAQRRITIATLPSIEEMTENCKLRYPQYAVQWAELGASIYKVKKGRDHKQRRIVRQTGFKPYYRVAIAGLVAAIIVFFTLIPTGRSMAKEIFGYIIRVFENHAEITQQYSETGRETNGISIIVDGTYEVISEVILYSSIDEFCMKTKLKPFMLSNDSWNVTSVQGQYDPDFGQTIWITYSDKDGNWIRLTQEWFKGTVMDTWTEDQSYMSTEIRNGYTLYYGINPSNGEFGGIVLLNDSVLSIGASNGQAFESILDALK